MLGLGEDEIGVGMHGDALGMGSDGAERRTVHPEWAQELVTDHFAKGRRSFA